MSKQQRGSRKLSVTLQAISVLFLSACAHDTGSCELIPLKEYDDFFKAGLALEVARMSEQSPTFIFIRDGIQLRDAVRACRNQ